MRIFLIGGGSGGHITPLLAVARELRQLEAEVELVGVCERGAKFVDLYTNDKNISQIFQVSAGKYRRYSGLHWWQRLFDVKTWLLNFRDIGKSLAGYRQAYKLLKLQKPDVLLIKGGFVGVPMGLAAARLKIPFLTHDSDSLPGLANRIISRWASLHATGMPAELYKYPKDKTVYTGIPISDEFKKLSASLKATYRDQIGLNKCDFVVAVTGGSQGGSQLNDDFVHISGRLMQKDNALGIVHIAGPSHEQSVRKAYNGELLSDERGRVVVRGFVNDLYAYTGAADVVVTRAGASAIAELSVQQQAIIVVPGKLAGGHQDKNAAFLENKGAAMLVPYGDDEALYSAVMTLKDDIKKRAELADNLHQLAKPDAAKELADATLKLARSK